MEELPTLDQGQTQPRMRADAARNRAAILSAAERLFAEQGVECTSVDQIAKEAGVGKGTIYRAFGDRSSLSLTLLDERERQLQDGLISGPPPLGPGAPACERILAFGRALIDFTERNAEILLDIERSSSGGPGFVGSAPYAVRRLHLRSLLAEVCDGSTDLDYLADALLISLSPMVYLVQRRDRGMSRERIESGWADLIERSLA